MTTFLRPPDAPRNHLERATSLLEVTMVSALLLVVIGSLLGVFDGFTRAEKGIEQRLDAEAELRSAMAEVTRDLRAADPVLAAPASSEMSDAVTFGYPSSDGGAPATVRFRVDAADGQLVREVLDGDGGKVTDARRVLTGIPESEDGAFAYFDATGSELVPGLVSAEEIAACAARIDVTLTQETGGGGGADPVTRRREASVALRNRQSEGVPC